MVVIAIGESLVSFTSSSNGLMRNTNQFIPRVRRSSNEYINWLK